MFVLFFVFVIVCVCFVFALCLFCLCCVLVCLVVVCAVCVSACFECALCVYSCVCVCCLSFCVAGFWVLGSQRGKTRTNWACRKTDMLKRKYDKDVMPIPSEFSTWPTRAVFGLEYFIVLLLYCVVSGGRYMYNVFFIRFNFSFC